MIDEEDYAPIKSMLSFVRQYPQLLEEAPIEALVEPNVSAVRRVEKHLCLRCGWKANDVVVARTPTGPRWLDLCYSCHHSVMFWLWQARG